MELLRGWPLLIQQFKSLFYKNILLSWRNKLASFLRLFSSLVFMFLIFCIQKAIESSYSSSTSFKTVLNPSPIVSFTIPQCEDKFLITLPCFDFVWSGNDSRTITDIVNRIMINNPGRHIPSYKVQSFRSPNEVDEWLFNNQMRCPGALHFLERNTTVLSYGVQINSTLTPERGHYENPTFKFQIPLQTAAEREIARSLIGDSQFSWEVGLMEFARPAPEMLDAMYTLGPTCFLAIAMFGFVFQINALVAEKELKLRQAMTMMGMYDSVYWLSWFLWEGIVTLISVFFTMLSGMMFQFNFFLHNNFAVIFLLFFLFQFNMLVFAFMLSAFVRKSSSSTNVGFSFFIIAFLCQLVTEFGFPYMKRFSNSYRIIWSFFPPNLFAQGLQLLAGATLTPEDPGVSWSRRTICAPNDTECVTTVNGIYLWLVLTYFLCFALAIYFDNIIPDSSGVRKSLIYFLKPRYWINKGENSVEEGSACSCKTGVPLLESVVPDDEDVLEEETIVKKQIEESSANNNVAVQLRGLVKIYPGTTNIYCCQCRRTSPYQALKGLWINFAKDQLFCLLGPNGAGKTTAINCLTGITPVTSGDAHVYGFSIRSPTDMSKIRRIIGVCPQFDILWNALSGEEHLHLFASLKGLPHASVKSVVEKSLAEVKLTESAKIRSGSYSGGMKRRLSVAVALIGEPKLLILDEPTTGMDPITRRHVWDIIENAKKGRAIILTTHSMEEADILSDRIGIVAKGRLRCIGTSIRLKSRFGTGFVANVRFSDVNRIDEDNISTTQQEAVKRFFQLRLDVIPKEENKSFLTFVIPHDKERLLTNFFAELEDREKEFGIVDIQLGLSSLEEVFLNIAKEAELESAAAEGRFATLNLSSGASVQIPVGARYVGIPGNVSAENAQGVMVEVFWEQDDSGSLCISHYSQEMPIPSSHVQQIPPSSTVAQSGIIRGFIIDPIHINQCNL